MALTECESQPECAEHLTCLYRCPVGANGDVDEPCEASCPLPAASAAVDALDALSTCRDLAFCEACGTTQWTHPILNQQCEPIVDEDECEQCQVSVCCDTLFACREDPICGEVVDCMRTCAQTQSAAACKQQCYPPYQGTATKYGQIFSCVINRCSVECGGSDDVCVTCLSEACGDQDVACEIDESCAIYEGCVVECSGDRACIDACGQGVPPEVIETQRAFTACGVLNCVEECGEGPF